MAINWDILKAQCLQANQATQLDSLALNLTSIQLLARSGTDESVAQHLIRESQLFIEWAVLGINLETDIAFATDLVALQRLLSRWRLGWSELCDEAKRQEMAALAQQCATSWGRSNDHRIHGQGELLTS